MARVLRLHEKGGKHHAMPCHHALAEALHAYIAAAGVAEDRKGWLFRTSRGHDATKKWSPNLGPAAKLEYDRSTERTMTKKTRRKIDAGMKPRPAFPLGSTFTTQSAFIGRCETGRRWRSSTTPPPHWLAMAVDMWTTQERYPQTHTSEFARGSLLVASIFGIFVARRRDAARPFRITWQGRPITCMRGLLELVDSQLSASETPFFHSSPRLISF
jgi:hypothetical protein